MRYFVLKPVDIPTSWLQASCSYVPTEKALGMVTAREVRCVSNVPNYTTALRDGWAVRSADNGMARKKALWSVENGENPKQLLPGQAVWVNTGGHIPLGADAVIDSNIDHSSDFINTIVEPGENIELEGSDWHHGEVILSSETRIGAKEMALLFEAGVDHVEGWAVPRIAIVATGSEMVENFGTLDAGLRHCSNASYTAALMSRIGIRDIRTLLVPDDTNKLTHTLQTLSSETDLIITIGGTGKGKRDYTRTAILNAGGNFVGSDSQTDSPFVMARFAHSGLIGLPGNPLAVMMIVQCVLLEAVRRVFHLPETPLQTVQAILSEDIDEEVTGELCVSLMSSGNNPSPLVALPMLKGTGRMRVFESANGFVHLGGHKLKRGEIVPVTLFRN